MIAKCEFQWIVSILHMSVNDVGTVFKEHPVCVKIVTVTRNLSFNGYDEWFGLKCRLRQI